MSDAMFAFRKPAPRCTAVALIEIEASADDIGDTMFYLDWLLARESFDARLEALPVAADGKAPLRIWIDVPRSRRAGAVLARALMARIQSIANDGGLPGYRLIEGAQWLSSGAADSELHRDRPNHWLASARDPSACGL
jgi:CubicO group peptidase (beta-lactamase class C family)